MGIRDEIVDLPAMQVGDEWYEVSLQLWHDGTKYAGRLWFAGAGMGEGGMPGRRLFYGSTREDVIDRVGELGAEAQRGQFRHAMVDRRRYLLLRAATDEILNRVRELNAVAVAWRTGVREPEDAERAMDGIESQLHELVDGLREVAGIEDRPA
ncbi:MAG: hypothetical protein WKG32_08160 [Gemmatimonadaceae bacterium]